MNATATKKTTRRKPCDYCRTIRDLLKPTMDEAKHDSMFCFMSRMTLDRIYANAKKGAK